MIVLVGLGNPGDKYAKNRHNVGFIVMDALAYKWQTEFKHDKKFNAEVAEIKAGLASEEPVLLVKPQTFMNNSGEAVQKILNFYKLETPQVWLIFDELDLPLGTVKVRKSGGAGTHNGVKSVVGHIGKDFPRFRIGIESRGDTASRLQDTASFVLSDFFGKEKDILVQVIETTIHAIETGLRYGLDSAMNKFN